MSHHQRKIMPPGGIRKRKEKEGEAFSSANAKPSNRSASPTPEPSSSKRLLAGYMAYEFLTKGTLLGEKFDPARAEAVPLSGSSSADQSKRMKPLPQQAAAAAAPNASESSLRKEHNRYAVVASLLKTDGVHVPGIVNPTQLSRWMQM